MRLRARERDIRAEYTGLTDMPCEDSCLEFFFSPRPGDSRYFNIEFNPNCCMYLGLCDGRDALVRLLPEGFSLLHQRHRQRLGPGRQRCPGNLYHSMAIGVRFYHRHQAGILRGCLTELAHIMPQCIQVDFPVVCAILHTSALFAWHYDLYYTTKPRERKGRIFLFPLLSRG